MCFVILIIWDWSLTAKDYGNELIRAPLTFGEDNDAKHEDEDEKSVCKKNLLKRLKGMEKAYAR